MPRIAANLTMLFPDLAFPDRIAAAGDAGFKAVEYLFPYEYAASDLRAWNDAAGVEQVLINAPAGDWASGERGVACFKDRTREFRDGVMKAIDYAKALDCPRIHLVGGLVDREENRPELEETYCENLSWAADQLAAHNIMGLVELLNSRDVPGYLVPTTRKAIELMDRINKDNIHLQFDVYHVQIMEGDVVTRFRQLLDRIGHVQIANPPNRHEPHIGELNYPYIFQAMDDAGYDGWVACEYIPEGDTRAGLTWGVDYGLRPV